MPFRWFVSVFVLAVLSACALAQDKPAAADAVDFRKLKELLPAELNGIKRNEHTGEKIKLGEFVMSTAKAEYGTNSEKENPPTITVEIQDFGATKGMADALTIWSTAEIDRDGDDGYEKTLKVKEHPAKETWNKESKSGEIMVWVAKRYIVTLRTENLPSEQMKKAAETLPLDKLAALK